MREEVDKVLDEIQNVLARGGGDSLSRSLLLADMSAALPPGESLLSHSLSRTPRARRSASPKVLSVHDRLRERAASRGSVSPPRAGSGSLDVAKYLARTGRFPPSLSARPTAKISKIPN